MFTRKMHNCLFIFKRIKYIFFLLLFVKCELNKHLAKNTKVIGQKDCNIAFLFLNIANSKENKAL